MEDFIKSVSIFKAISLRYFNPIGAHKSGEIEGAPSGFPNNLIPFITQTAVGVREELKVFGNDYKTYDGIAIRDYIHVMDLSEAHVLAFKRLAEDYLGGSFEIFNIGTGIGYSVLEVISSFEKTSKQKLNYSISKRREGDVLKMYADATM